MCQDLHIPSPGTAALITNQLCWSLQADKCEFSGFYQVKGLPTQAAAGHLVLEITHLHGSFPGQTMALTHNLSIC